MGEIDQYVAWNVHKIGSAEEMLLRDTPGVWLHRVCMASDVDAHLVTQGEEIERLEKELERERIRLAACGVVALANIAASAREARSIQPEYDSDSLQHVIAAVDREMALRTAMATLQAELEGVRRERQEAFEHRLTKDGFCAHCEAYKAGWLGDCTNPIHTQGMPEVIELRKQLAEARFKHDELADQSSADTDRFIEIMSSLKTICPEASSIERGVTLLTQQLAAREGQVKVARAEVWREAAFIADTFTKGYDIYWWYKQTKQELSATICRDVAERIRQKAHEDDECDETCLTCQAAREQGDDSDVDAP